MHMDIKEGDLYKRITVMGRTFPLYYGYYDEIERHSKYNDPIPIYPNFLEEPQYADNGVPFVTAMQNACSYYEGHDAEYGCQSCKHYMECEDLIGICRCQERKWSAVTDRGRAER